MLDDQRIVISVLAFTVMNSIREEDRDSNRNLKIQNSMNELAKEK